MENTKATNQTSVAPATATNSANEITTTTIDILKPESSNFLSLTGSDIDSMSYNQLDGLVTDGCEELVLSSKKAKEIRKTLKPVIIRMHGLLTSRSQGARTDLADAPTWEGWMKKHEAFGSPSAFYRILRKAKVLPLQVGDAYITLDDQAVKISHVHNTAPNKVDVEIDLHDGNPPVTKTYELNDLKPLNPKPTYCATTPHRWDVDVAISAAHKFMRWGDEGNAVYWIKQLYFANAEGRSQINVWKQLHIYACEDIGLADLSVKTHVLELEQIAGKCKDNRHSDLMMVVEAMLICCRAKKSRAADNAIIWFVQNPTYKAPTPEEIESAVKTNQPKPVVPDDSPIYDRHTAKGRRMGRKNEAGMEHFLAEGARLENESDVVPFTPPAEVPSAKSTPVAEESDKVKTLKQQIGDLNGTIKSLEDELDVMFVELSKYRDAERQSGIKLADPDPDFTAAFGSIRVKAAEIEKTDPSKGSDVRIMTLIHICSPTFAVRQARIREYCTVSENALKTIWMSRMP